MLHQQAEFITAETGQRVAFSDVLLQQLTKLAQQLIAGHVAAGVIYQLELIQIEITKRILGGFPLGRFQHTPQAAFKFAAINQSGQSIVGSLVRDLLG